MRELSLHILDIVENSIRAKATLVEVFIVANSKYLTIKVKDDGIGMNKEFLTKVLDPFTTTRTTRNVGMGLPLFKQAAEDAGGEFKVASEEGIGTEVIATFLLDSVNRLPLGDVPATICTFLCPDVDLYWYYEIKGKSFAFDTRAVKEQLGKDISIDSPEIQSFIKSMLEENIESINGGITI